MHRTRAARNAAEAGVSLTGEQFASLPEELMLIVARHALAARLPDALHLRQVCAAFLSKLGPVKEEAEARRLAWVPELTAWHTIDGRCVHFWSAVGSGASWAAASRRSSGSSTTRPHACGRISYLSAGAGTARVR